MFTSFNTSVLPPLYFGAEALSHLPRLGIANGARALIVHGAGLAHRGNLLERTQQALLGRGVWSMTAAIVGEPTVECADELAALARARGIQSVIAIGGGSALDAGKAIAALVPMRGSAVEFLEGVGTRKHTGESLPWIAIPTTAGTGSEATSNAVLKGSDEKGVPYKRSLRHPNFLPTAILLDPALQQGMPKDITAACAMDALSQLLESYTSTMANPVTDAIVSAGLRHSAKGLMMLQRGEDELELRGHLALAAMCSGYGLGNAGLGLVHGAAGLLGAMRDVPHGVVCGSLIAPAFSATQAWLEANPSATALVGLDKLRWADTLFSGEKSLPETLAELSADLQIPKLSSYGFTPDDMASISKLASNRNSPALLSAPELQAVLCESL